jgi:hypothetical protein
MMSGHKNRMVGRADPELYCPANTLRESAGVSSAFERKGLFRAAPAPEQRS